MGATGFARHIRCGAEGLCQQEFLVQGNTIIGRHAGVAAIDVDAGIDSARQNVESESVPHKRLRAQQCPKSYEIST